jgi:glycosyltransferase involved in cell wall biosynthesis
MGSLRTDLSKPDCEAMCPTENVPAMVIQAPTAVAPPGREQRASLPFDSVVCFAGVDWWYHNRGHYDVQMMHQLARHVPVLFVNSIGMRVPHLGEGGLFFVRVRRKLRSIRRGIVQVQEGFNVFSPLHVPGGMGRVMSTPLLRWQIRAVMRWLGFRRPLVWVAVPSAGEVAESIAAAGLVYQRTDRFEEFPGVDQRRIAALDARLKRRADLTLFCATSLMTAESEDCRRAVFIDHGVDFDRFVRGASEPEPEEMRKIGRPRIGFVGAIDPHTFDPDLLRDLVRRLPDLQFVLVGGSTLPPDWIAEPNLHRLGQKCYDEVWRYPGACDVLIMPWNRSSWIRDCNPVKLKEYLATGRPIVTTDFDELRRYDGLVTVATDAESFAAGIRMAVASAADAAAQKRRRERVRAETWQAKGAQALQVILDALDDRS